jgi:glycosyltransferase involved in cell wall biosynthesis
VVHVLHLIDSLVPGGAESSLADMAPYLVRAGVQVDVAYLLDRPGVQQKLIDAGADVFALDGPGGRIGRARRALALVRERDPDLIHTSLWEADVTGRIAAALTSVPVVTSLVNESYGPQQFDDPQLRRWKVRAAQAIDAVTARRVRRFHAVTTSVADTMARRLLVKRDRIDVIPRGRDPGRLGQRTSERRVRARATLGATADDLVVLAAARHERQKGLDILLSAAPTILELEPRARLFVAGREGNQTSELRALSDATRPALPIQLLGQRDDVPDLLCAADVFVLPSRWEGIAGVLLEAMALEVPIVASDLPGVREVVDDTTAVLVPPSDSFALAEGVVRVLRDRAGSANRARAARARFLDAFTVDRVATQMISFYERSLRTRPQRGQRG